MALEAAVSDRATVIIKKITLKFLDKLNKDKKTLIQNTPFILLIKTPLPKQGEAYSLISLYTVLV